MGSFTIEIKGVGDHGQDREKGEGEGVDFTKGGDKTPDALASAFVDALKEAGVNVESATITHWPGQTGEVKDDLVTGMRRGNF